MSMSSASFFGRTKIATGRQPVENGRGTCGRRAFGKWPAGAALWWITPFTPLQAAAMALAIVAMGFLGGLALSGREALDGRKGLGLDDQPAMAAYSTEWIR